MDAVMKDLDRLASIAQQLVARIRDDDPEANARWLHGETTAADRDALLYVLAAAVPDDRTWGELVSWVDQDIRTVRRRKQWRESKRRQYARKSNQRRPDDSAGQPPADVDAEDAA